MEQRSALRRTIDGLTLGAMLLLSSLAFVGCDDSEEAAGCANDLACPRGQVCNGGSCTTESCASINACSGTGRTCLLDTQSCSAKECADVPEGASGICPDERPVCLETGPFRFSCADPAISCQSGADCSDLGQGYQCCGGVCGTDCPVGGAGGMGGAGGGIIGGAGGAGGEGGMAGGEGGAGGMAGAGGEIGGAGGMINPEDAQLCSPCRGVDDCAGLGEGAECTGFGANAHCTSACDPADAEACPSGFRCDATLTQCVPFTYRCEGCFLNGCGAGEICGLDGNCNAPAAVCGACTGPEGCQDGLSCAPLADGDPQSFCLAPCGAGCGDGYVCEDDLCKPQSGRCDACGGTCGGDTPACIAATGECAECGPDVPCDAGEVCRMDNTCGEAPMGGCVQNVDCQAQDPNTPICFVGQCVQCIQDSDCMAGFACEGQACVAAPCRGTECQMGSECNINTGRCDPGCNADADCPDPMIHRCNVATGQCYDGVNATCDGEGGVSVCYPGAQCLPNALDPSLGGNCSCIKRDPADFFEPPENHILPCQPGQACLQFDPMSPGFCIILPF
ncbi:MAG: hypothetical protein ACE366_13005 [Bradymonadia bacterium]